MRSFRDHSERGCHLAWRPEDLEHHLTEELGGIPAPSDYGTYKPPSTPDHLRADRLPKSDVDHHTDSIMRNDHLEHFKGVDSKLSDEHREAVSDYKWSSEPINSPLRSGRREGHLLIPNVPGRRVFDEKNHREAVKSHLNKVESLDSVTGHRVPFDMHVYRGWQNVPMHHLEPGREFTDHGYTGTSTKRSIANSFAGLHHGTSWGHPHLAGRSIISQIHVPAGTRGHFLDADPDASAHSKESEFLLHRGTRFRVEGHRLVGDRLHVVDLSIVGQHPKQLRSQYHEDDSHVGTTTRHFVKKYGFDWSNPSGTKKVLSGQASSLSGPKGNLPS